MPSPKSSKYQPLADFLTRQSADEVVLTFAQIEGILRLPLPAAAYIRQWWMTTAVTYAHVQAWRRAGWEATALTWRGDERWVTFRRRPAATDDNCAR